MTTQTQTGTVWDNLLATVEANEVELKKLNKELERLQTVNLNSAIAYNDLKNQLNNTKVRLCTSNIHLFRFLDEMECAFERTKEFESPAICGDYLEAAKYCKQYYGRSNNMIDEAQSWYDNYKL